MSIQRLLKWYRNLPFFEWHNKRYHEIKRKLVQAEACRDVLQERIDNWIARSEGGRYRELYLELKNKPHHLEAHANRQAKIINWLQAEFNGSLHYPKGERDLLTRARRAVKDG